MMRGPEDRPSMGDHFDQNRCMVYAILLEDIMSGHTPAVQNGAVMQAAFKQFPGLTSHITDDASLSDMTGGIDAALDEIGIQAMIHTRQCINRIADEEKEGKVYTSAAKGGAVYNAFLIRSVMEIEDPSDQLICALILSVLHVISVGEEDFERMKEKDDLHMQGFDLCDAVTVLRQDQPFWHDVASDMNLPAVAAKYGVNGQ